MRRRVRLTESDLHRIVKESVKKILIEGDFYAPALQDNDEECWSVWVGGGEVNDYPLTRIQAEKLAQKYKNDGYDDVAIDKSF